MFTCQAISSVLMTRVNSLRVGFWRSCSPLVIQNHKGTCWKVFCCHGCTIELFWHIFPRLKRWKKSCIKRDAKKSAHSAPVSHGAFKHQLQILKVWYYPLLDLQKLHNICTFGLLHVWAVLTVPRQNWTFQNKIEQAFPHHVTIPLNLG